MNFEGAIYNNIIGVLVYDKKWCSLHLKNFVVYFLLIHEVTQQAIPVIKIYVLFLKLGLRSPINLVL